MTDSYLPGAMVLGHSLRDSGTSKELVALVTLDTLSVEVIDELKVIDKPQCESRCLQHADPWQADHLHHHLNSSNSKSEPSQSLPYGTARPSPHIH